MEVKTLVHTLTGMLLNKFVADGQLRKHKRGGTLETVLLLMVRFG